MWSCIFPPSIGALDRIKHSSLFNGPFDGVVNDFQFADLWLVDGSLMI